MFVIKETVCNVLLLPIVCTAGYFSIFIVKLVYAKNLSLLINTSLYMNFTIPQKK